MKTDMLERKIATSPQTRWAPATAFGCLAIVLSAVSPVAHGQTYRVLASFDGTNGANPWGGLTASGSTLYGMTSQGGGGYGNIFSINTDGSGGINSLVSFTGKTGNYQGAYPHRDLIVNGTTLYGMTTGFNDSNNTNYSNGNIFSVNTNGTNFQNLHSFTEKGADPTGA